MKPKHPTWQPATEFRVVRLPANGPKSGQSIDRWLYGKERAHQELMDNPRKRFTDLPR